MKAKTLAQAVGASSYPGRSIIIGKSKDGRRALLIYFIMGRSVNSRNRIFVQEGDGIRTEAFDPSAMKDPSLVIYAPVRALGNRIIVTNGDQTDTIYEYLQNGKSFCEALRTRQFEPDAPHYTPRISALCAFENGGFALEMSALKCSDQRGEGNARFFWEYDALEAGCGYFIHTYQGDGNPLPSFEGEPEHVTLPDSAQEAAQEVWNALDAENKVSLWVQSVCLRTGERETVIINKNK